MAPGGKGTKTGRTLERVIKTVLEDNEYIFKEQKTIGKALFGNSYRADFIVHVEEDREIIISCKWQQVRGTTEQKLIYDIASLIKIIKESNGRFVKAYVVIGGGGFSPQAKKYLLSQKFREILRDGDLVEVLDLDSIIYRINKDLL